MNTIEELLNLTVQFGGSDLHIKGDTPPLVRVRGDLLPLNMPPLTVDEARALSFSAITELQKQRFEEELELDFAYSMPGVARFRGNLFQQRGNVQSVFRHIPLKIQTMAELGIPEVCRFFSERPRGLVLITGAAGTGKTTTLAAMIDYINEHYPLHIMTIEDPVEFVHTDKKALINQRELYRDTHSFSNSLRAVLRQDPDVILVGEMRDLETMALAVTAAETGHLVFGTLHTTDAVQTIDRVIDVFPQYQQQQIRMQLSVNLVGVVSQTLVKTIDGTSRIAAFETLVGVPSVRSLIREGKSHQISSLIQTGMKQGMMTMDQSLSHLVREGLVAFEEGLAHAQNITEFTFLCKGQDEDIIDIAPADSMSFDPSPTPIAQPHSGPRLPFGFKRS